MAAVLVAAIAGGCGADVPSQAATAKPAPAKQSVPTPAPAPTIAVRGTLRAPTTLPVVDAEKLYAQAPSPWREFLVQARKAEAIADPLARCLAYPQLPGAQWPAGLAQAHCEYVFGARPSLEEISAHIDAGDAAWLEGTFRTLLDRHFSPNDLSEHIHDVLDYFLHSPDSARLSERWLQLAPESPFALTARGNYFRQLGWTARGERFIQETTEPQLQQMEAHHAQALALYKRALAKDSRLLDAHIGQVNLGRNDPELGAAAFAAGLEVDAGCKVLYSERMQARTPRWGGSYEEMGALAQQIGQKLEQRPLLVLSAALPFRDMADRLRQAKRYGEAVQVLLPVVMGSSSPNAADDLAWALSRTKDPDRWQVLAFAMAGRRIQPGDARIAALRGRLALQLASDLELARRELAWALSREPRDHVARFDHAEVLRKSQQYAEAEQEYLLAMKHDKPQGSTYTAALVVLPDVVARAGKPDAALAYANRAVAELPGNVYAWRALEWTLRDNGAPAAQRRKALVEYLRLIDRKDPYMAGDLAYAERALRDLDAAAP